MAITKAGAAPPPQTFAGLVSAMVLAGVLSGLIIQAINEGGRPRRRRRR